MKKTASVTLKMSPALKLRLIAEARRKNKTVSSFLEEELAACYYGRGRRAKDFEPQTEANHAQSDGT